MNNYQLKRIAEARDKSNLLTKPERDFIKSLSGLDQAKELTEKDNHILNRISQKMG
jgi:hypothetical protein